ncbi:hypothetical protein [Luteibacter yeojuensis]|uniref:Uncharacterized protein n=1 Tax=Luteibacter yeojuensis TaxID=345309 RepID=A0A7X5QTY6_9GAMM|nr:hypothetical protein [Luteibacter yeojuensis]NID15366.1 hypothetical protein [Luteibacter yeojuensis]
MSISNEELADTLRVMAWERAKGELQSTLRTFYGRREQFEALSQAIDSFVKQVEDEGLID